MSNLGPISPSDISTSPHSNESALSLRVFYFYLLSLFIFSGQVELDSRLMYF